MSMNKNKQNVDRF